MNFLTVDEIIDAHKLLTAVDEDKPALTRRGVVESAVHRCREGPVFEVGDLAERAAYLLRGLACDHGFSNGNKRIGFASAEVFLQRNGRYIEATADEVVSFMLAVVQTPLSIEEIAAWLRTHGRNL